MSEETERANVWREFYNFGPWTGLTRTIHGITDWILDEFDAGRLVPFGDACGGPCPKCPNFSEGCSRTGECKLGYVKEMQ